MFSDLWLCAPLPPPNACLHLPAILGLLWFLSFPSLSFSSSASSQPEAITWGLLDGELCCTQEMLLLWKG